MELKKSSYIHLAIMFVLAFGISALPPFGQITPFGMKAIGVFVAVLYGWITFDLFWTSLFGFLIIPVLGLNTVAGSFGTGLGNQMIIIVLLTMALAVALNMAGVTDLVANWLLQRKIIRKSPWFLIIGIFAIAAILGMTGLGMAAAFLLWSIVLKIADYTGIKKGDSLLSYMIMFITVIAMTEALVFPFSPGVLIYLSFLMQVTPVGIPTLPFIIFSFITINLVMVFAVVVTKFILKVDASKFCLPEHVLKEIENTKPTSKQKMSFAVLVAYMIVLLVASIFTTLPGASFINTLGVGGVSGIAILVLAVLNYDGKGLIEIKNVFAHLDWSLLYLLAVTYPIADLIKHPDAGIMPTIMTTIAPVVSQLGTIPFMIACMVILGIVTQVTHNIVLAAMFVPFLLPICAELGGNIYTLWFIIFLVLNLAYCTPAASMQSAMVFGHEMMERKHAYLTGIVIIVVGWAVYSIVGIPLGNALFAGLV